MIGAFLLCTLSVGLTMMNNSNPSIPILLNGIVILETQPKTGIFENESVIASQT